MTDHYLKALYCELLIETYGASVVHEIKMTSSAILSSSYVYITPKNSTISIHIYTHVYTLKISGHLTYH